MFGGRVGLPELVILLIVVVVIVKAGRAGRYVLGGFLLGALAGFLLRPSVPMVGQLPFDVVVTRGANLSGVEVVMRSTAERSFNYMLVAAIIGAVVLGIGAGLTAKRESEDTDTRAKSASASVVSGPPTSNSSRFCTKCGERAATDSAFCGGCGARIT